MHSKTEVANIQCNWIMKDYKWIQLSHMRKPFWRWWFEMVNEFNHSFGLCGIDVSLILSRWLYKSHSFGRAMFLILFALYYRTMITFLSHCLALLEDIHNNFLDKIYSRRVCQFDLRKKNDVQSVIQGVYDEWGLRFTHLHCNAPCLYGCV